MASWLDKTGLTYFWGKCKAAFAAKTHTHAAGDITSGTLPLDRGGTGQTTAKDAAYALLNGLPTWTATPNDNTYMIRQDTAGAATYGKVKFSTIWNYIKGKADSVYSSNRMDPRNLFILSTDCPGYLLQDGTMEGMSSEGEKTSDFIPVSTSTKYRLKIWNSSGDQTNFPTWYCVQFFASDKTTKVGQFFRGEPGTADVNELIDMANFQTSAYVRISSRWLAPYYWNTWCKVMFFEDADGSRSDAAYQLAPEDCELYEYRGNLGNGCWFYCHNRICILHFEGTVNLASAWTSIEFAAYIPGPRFWPMQAVYAPAISDNNGGRCARLWVSTTGHIGITGRGGTAIGNQNCTADLVWMC